MKQLLLTIAVLLYSTFAWGIDLIVPASSGGTYYCLTRESDSEGLKMADCKEEYENGIDKQFL